MPVIFNEVLIIWLIFFVGITFLSITFLVWIVVSNLVLYNSIRIDSALENDRIILLISCIIQSNLPIRATIYTLSINIATPRSEACFQFNCTLNDSRHNKIFSGSNAMINNWPGTILIPCITTTKPISFWVFDGESFANPSIRRLDISLSTCPVCEGFTFIGPIMLWPKIV